MNIKTPMLNKINDVKDHSQAIGEFLDWIREEKNCDICDWLDGEYSPINTNTEKLLADFFGIDLQQAEKERQAILDNINGR